MNTGTDVYVIEPAKLDSLTIPQGALFYKAVVEDYNKDTVLIIIKDSQQRQLLKTVPRAIVYESFQKALEALNVAVKEPLKESNLIDFDKPQETH